MCRVELPDERLAHGVVAGLTFDGNDCKRDGALNDSLPIAPGAAALRLDGWQMIDGRHAFGLKLGDRPGFAGLRLVRGLRNGCLHRKDQCKKD